MKIVAAVKHYPATDAMLIKFGAVRVYKMYSDAVVIDTITDDFIIGQYVSNVELYGFDLHWENL